MKRHTSTSQTFIDGIYHSPDGVSGKELLKKLLQEYVFHRVSGLQNDREIEFASIQKIKSHRISPQENIAIIRAAKMSLSHTLTIFCNAIGKRKLRISAIPHLIRALPTHAMESYFCLRTINEQEYNRLISLPIATHLTKDHLINHNIPSDQMAISLVFQLIKQSISNDEIILLLNDLSPYKSRKLIASTGRFIPLSVDSSNQKNSLFSYLQNAKTLTHQPKKIDQILSSTNARTIEGISSHLMKNNEDLVKSLSYISIDHIQKSRQAAYSLLRFYSSEKLMNLFGIALPELVKIKPNNTEHKTILTLLIEGAAWHRESPQAARLLALYLRLYQVIDLPLYMKRLLYDAISDSDIKEIWRTTMPVLKLANILEAHVQLQRIRSHELTQRYSSLICNKKTDEWYEFIKNPIGKGNVKNKIVENQLIVLAQCIHRDSFDELKTVLKTLYLPDELIKKIEKILYIRITFQQGNYGKEKI